MSDEIGYRSIEDGDPQTGMSAAQVTDQKTRRATDGHSDLLYRRHRLIYLLPCGLCAGRMVI